MIQESISKLAEIETTANPFPGLRPFELHESHLFFGRDGQSEQLIARLNTARFLAVVGTSGSGKSSLVRAGLLPVLLGGMMPRAGSVWHVALMRPGNDPIGNLAKQLCSPDAFGSDDQENRNLQIAITEATLRRGNLGLVEVVRQANMPASENLLVIADQFEELFRVEQTSARAAQENDKAAFVKLLLAAARQTELPIYVVLTMRSEYLGDCAQFQDLPEAINEGQYLIPRLTREQRREAITGPIAVGGAEITPRLVNRLLNDMGDNPDQLPILQHALMRTWDEWKRERESGGGGEREVGRPGDRETGRQGGRETGGEGDRESWPSEPSSDAPSEAPAGAIDLRHYEVIGGLANALSGHADEAYEEIKRALGERGEQITQKMFKALTEKGADNREVRRPTTLAKLCDITQATAPDLIAIIERFRAPGRSFLTPSFDVPLDANSLIDISHESLIRNWKGGEQEKRLREWVEEEAESARDYERLAETSALHKEGKAGLWRNPDLQLALDWQQKHQPNQAWAERYCPGWDTALAFLEASAQAIKDEERQEAERSLKEKQRTRIFITVLLLLCATAIYIAIYALVQRQTAVARRIEAEEKERLNQRYLYAASINLAQRSYEAGDFARAAALLEDRFSEDERAEAEAQRGFEWHWLRTLTHNEIDTIRAHDNTVTAVAVSSNGQWLATTSHDKSVRLWDLNIRRQMAGLLDGQPSAWMGAVTLPGHQDAVWAVAFAPDGKTLATGSRDKTVKLWDVETRQEVATLTTHTDDVWDIAFSSDGQTLATSSDDATIKLWNFHTRQELATIKGHQGGVYTVAFSPAGDKLASGGADKTVKLWDAKSGKLLTSFAEHQAEVFTVQFSPDGKLLATAGVDRTIELWDVKTRRNIASLFESHGEEIGSVVFSPDGKLLVSASDDGSIRLWDVAAMVTATRRRHNRDGATDIKTQARVDSFAGHNDNVNSVVFAPDGKTLASGSSDGTVKLWDARARLNWTVEGGHRQNVYSIAYAPDGTLLATASADKAVKLLDGKTGHEQATLTGHSDTVWATAFSPDLSSGGLLASASKDKTIKLWDVAARKEVSTLNGHTRDATAVAFSADGKLLASGSVDQTVKLWDVQSRRELASLSGHNNTVLAVAFSPDGKWLASGDHDGIVQLWDVSARQVSATFVGHEKSVWSVSFSPDGNTLATGSADKRAKLWDVASRREIETRIWHLRDVWSVVFSPDGKVLASSSEDKTVKLWDVKTRQELLTLTNLQRPLRSIAFAPDSRALAGVGAGGYFHMFLAEPVQTTRKRLSLDK